jgi:AraC-like DNA-binding protein
VGKVTIVHLPDHSRADPVQQCGSYRAWQLGCEAPGVTDLAWYSYSGPNSGERQRLLPFTEPSLALRRRFNADGQTSDWDFVIFRAQPGGGSYNPAPGEELFALRLAPEMMERGLRIKATDFLDQDYAPPPSLALHLGEASRAADRGEFHAAWGAMLDALRALPVDLGSDRIGVAAGLARRSHGAFAPAELADHVGLSARHMRRGFVDRLGLSPRAVLRRQRLTAAMLHAETADRPAWADIAAAHGFSDQAHMIRECRSLTGDSPGEWHKVRRTMSVSFNAALKGAATSGAR